jgi:long-chain acyl-CoA synthetase
LAGFVKRVESSADGIPPVQEIRVAGGVLPQHLMHQLWRLFHAKIYNDYGSTEVGGVCFDLVEQNRRPDRAGWVLPRAQVHIVDEFDQAQPFGTEGIVRTKTSGMAYEYFKNPEATAKCFKDGWFYPGDRGRLNKNGPLFLTGRQSEISITAG